MGRSAWLSITVLVIAAACGSEGGGPSGPMQGMGSSGEWEGGYPGEESGSGGAPKGGSSSAAGRPAAGTGGVSQAGAAGEVSAGGELVVGGAGGAAEPIGGKAGSGGAAAGTGGVSAGSSGMGGQEEAPWYDRCTGDLNANPKSDCSSAPAYSQTVWACNGSGNPPPNGLCKAAGNDPPGPPAKWCCVRCVADTSRDYPAKNSPCSAQHPAFTTCADGLAPFAGCVSTPQGYWCC